MLKRLLSIACLSIAVELCAAFLNPLAPSGIAKHTHNFVRHRTGIHSLSTPEIVKQSASNGTNGEDGVFNVHGNTFQNIASVGGSFMDETPDSLAHANNLGIDYTPETHIYLPHYMWHENFVRKNLDGLEEIELPKHVQYWAGQNAAAHLNPTIHSRLYTSKAFRRIRTTYFDGGEGIQVFNALWYPKYGSDAPLLGIDLLCFGFKKFLAVIDLQPLSKDKEYKDQYLEPVASIRENFIENFGGKVSNKLYDDHQWFSDDYMLYGRFDVPSVGIRDGELLEAMSSYVQYYVDMVEKEQAEKEEDSQNHVNSHSNSQRSEIDDHGSESWHTRHQSHLARYTAEHHSPAQEGKEPTGKVVNGLNNGGTSSGTTSDINSAGAAFGAVNLEEFVKFRQGEYDAYNSEKDPAHKLFCNYFGEEWANDYIHNFLFASTGDKPYGVES